MSETIEERNASIFILVFCDAIYSNLNWIFANKDKCLAILAIHIQLQDWLILLYSLY